MNFDGFPLSGTPLGAPLPWTPYFPDFGGPLKSTHFFTHLTIQLVSLGLGVPRSPFEVSGAPPLAYPPGVGSG